MVAVITLYYTFCDSVKSSLVNLKRNITRAKASPPKQYHYIKSFSLHPIAKASDVCRDLKGRVPEIRTVEDLRDLQDFAIANKVERVRAAIEFDNVGLALKGEANVWLDSQVTLKHIEGDREQWSIIRPYFKEEFATESDDKLILDGLAHMAMRPTENVRSFFGRLNAVNKVIKDAYDSYTIKPAAPVPDNNGNITMPFANCTIRPHKHSKE